MPRRIAFALAVVVVAASGCGSSKHAASTAAATGAAASPPPGTSAAEPPATPATTIELPAAGGTTAAVPPPPPTVAATTTVRSSSSAAVQQTLCPSEQTVGVTANFGQSRTKAGAQRILAEAAHVGFKNLQIERRRCHLYAVALPGLKNQRQGRALQREAGSVGIRVGIECRSHPFEGGLAAVFGHRRTRRAAVRLRRTVAHYGFKDLLVVQDTCNDWEVDLYGLKTTAERRAFAREAAGVGLHVAFEPG